MAFFIGFITTFILVAVLCVVIFLFRKKLYKSDVRYILNDSTLIMKSSFGGYIARNNIASVELTDTLPSTRYRSLGQSLFWLKEGTFTTLDGESIEIFNYAKTGSVICLTRFKGDRVYIRLNNQEETTELYDKLKM